MRVIVDGNSMTKDEAERRAFDFAHEKQNYKHKDDIDTELFDAHIAGFMECWRIIRIEQLAADALDDIDCALG